MTYLSKSFVLASLLFAALTVNAAPAGGDFTDNFEVRRLDTEHFSLWDNDVTIVNMGTRGMTIMSKGTTPADGNVVYFPTTDANWEAEANVVLYPTSKGGLVLMQDRDHYWGITANYRDITVVDASGTQKTIRNPYGRYLHLRLTYADGQLVLAAAPQKTPWRIIDNANPKTKRQPATQWTVVATLEPSALSQPAKICLMAMDKDVVSFRDFWYRTK